MGTYPIKILRDENGHPFVPLTSLDAVVGEKNLQYIMNAEEVSAGHFKIKLSDVQLDKILDTAVIIRWPNINSTVKPSYLQLNDEEEKPLYNGNGTEYLSLEEASNTINILAFNGDKWILASGSGTGGGGHVIANAEGSTMEQQKVLQFVGFNIENDTANRATKISNPQPINNLNTTEVGIGSLDAYQGSVLAKRSIPTGGKAGQVLAKVNEVDYQVEWVDKDGDDVITSNGSITKIIGLTYEEYKELESRGEINPTTQYHITDINDSDISFISQEDIQSMIDDSTELAYRLVVGNGRWAALHIDTSGGEQYRLQIEGAGNIIKYHRANDKAEWERVGKLLVDNEIADIYQPKLYDSGWIYPTLENGWEAYDADRPFKYRKIGEVVYLQGSVKNGAHKGVLFTMPVGFRPGTSYSNCPIRINGSEIGWFFVNYGGSGANGVVAIETSNPAGTSNFVECPMFNISYIAEA